MLTLFHLAKFYNIKALETNLAILPPFCYLRIIGCLYEECDEDVKQTLPCYVFPHPDADHGRCGQGKKAGKSSGKNPSGQSSVLLSIY